jgi:type VI secretion system secreted protein Hcp
MTVTGKLSGLMTKGAFTPESVGNIYQKGHEDQVMVQAFSHEVTIPCNPQSGQPTASRRHQPIVITKVFDKSSPLLLDALCRAEEITSVEIKWYRPSTNGDQEHYYTTKLEDAKIVHIKDYMHNCQDPTTAHFTHLQDVHFSYRRIEWSHVKSTTHGADDWGKETAV